MPTTFVKGDLFEDGADPSRPHAFAFAADCSGAMDKGIAIAFKKRWPELAEAYQAKAASETMQLGDVFVWREAPPQKGVVYALGISRGEKKPKVSTLARA